MHFGRSHSRSKSRSAAASPCPLSPATSSQSSRPPTFFPPSHYAAAAGIVYSKPVNDYSFKDEQMEKERGFSERERRKSQLGDLPLLEAQLLPSLRDTVDRMTNPPRPKSRADCSDYGDSQPGMSLRRYEEAPPPPVASSLPPPNSSLSRTTVSSFSTSIPRLDTTSSMGTRSALKSSLRRGAFAPTACKPSSRKNAMPDVGVSDSDSFHGAHSGNELDVEQPETTARMRQGRSPLTTYTKASAKTASALPRPKYEARSRSNPGTPQVHPRAAVFATPQPDRPSASPHTQSSLPRPRTSKPTPKLSYDSGSELERRVTLRHSYGRLVVTNADIVPSSSESDHNLRRAARRGAPALSAPPPVPTSPFSTTRSLLSNRRDQPVVSIPNPSSHKYAPVGLGLGMTSATQRTRLDEPSDDESIYEEDYSDHALLTDEPAFVSEDDGSIYDDEPPPPPPPPRRPSRVSDVDRETRRQQALLGLVDGLHRDYGRAPSPSARRSVAFSESDGSYTTQGLAISGSADLQANESLRISGTPSKRSSVLRVNRSGPSWDEESAYSDDGEELLNNKRSRLSLRQNSAPWKRTAPSSNTERTSQRSLEPYSTSPLPVSRSPNAASPKINVSSARATSPLLPSTGSHSRSHSRSPRRHRLSAAPVQEEASASSSTWLEPTRPSSRTSRSLSEKDRLDVSPRQEDANLRERLAFGIPESLSYCGSNGQSEEQPDATRLQPPLEGDQRTSANPNLSHADSELSLVGNEWEEQPRFSKELSKGAAALFETLASKDNGRPSRRRGQTVTDSDRTPVTQSTTWGSRSALKARSRTTGFVPDSAAGPNTNSRTRRRSFDSQPSTRNSSPASVYDDSPICAAPPAPEKAAFSRPSHSRTRTLPDVRTTAPDIPCSSTNDLTHPAITERQDFLRSLLSSEKAFVKSARGVIRTYFVPLRARDSHSWLVGLPSPIARLFDWLEDIVNVHAALVRSLQEHGAEIRALRTFAAQLEVYVPYVVKLDSAREALRWHLTEDQGAFGEYLRIKSTERPRSKKGEWTLEQLVEEPLLRLHRYLDVLQRLHNLTPKGHPDYLGTMSLLYATHTAVRVLDEVKAREDEYEFVKDLSTRIEGITSTTPLARRARRLLWYGILDEKHLQNGVHTRPRPSPDGPTTDDPKRPPAQRMSRLASAVRVWDKRRTRGGSLSSSASSMLSVHTSDTSSGASVLVTPRSDEFPWGVGGRARASSMSKAALASQQPRAPSAKPPPPPVGGCERVLNVMVFTDLVVLARPDASAQSEAGPGEEQRCTLLETVGLSRILDLAEQGDAVTLSLVPVAPDQLDTGVIAEGASISEFTLALPPSSGGGGGGDTPALLEALRKCRQHTVRALSFPALQGDAMGDLEIDTRQSLAGILSAGLPLPKSPSIQQLEDGVRVHQPRKDADADGEREERGWWTLRYQQVLRELQREEVPVALGVARELPANGPEAQ